MTFLAIVGGIALALLVLCVFLRGRAILRANKIAENTIRFMWAEMGETDPDEQDRMALELLRSTCLNAPTLRDYRLGLGVVRSLSKDIVKDKTRLADFKRELILYGQARGWTNI